MSLFLKDREFGTDVRLATDRAFRTPASPAPRRVRVAMALVFALICAGCAGGSHRSARWDGRRGYAGSGDYGYDLTASRAEARNYRAAAPSSYSRPGPSNDPWGPYVAEASNRFQVPPAWIRGVMRQESGGHLYDSSGELITSSAGAMGLMQVMPQTYVVLQARYGLGGDPYDPRNNILAGTAYIREMYDRYGAPTFLAAYNAGPQRVDEYLAGDGPLPDETQNYVASIAPYLGHDVPMRGPLAEYASAAPPASPDDPSMRAFDGGGLVTPEAPTGVMTAQAPRPAAPRPAAPPPVAPAPVEVASAPPPADPDDPSMRAFDGGGLVTAQAPTGVMTTPVQRQAVPAPVEVAAAPAPAPAPVVTASALGGASARPAQPVPVVQLASAQTSSDTLPALMDPTPRYGIARPIIDPAPTPVVTPVAVRAPTGGEWGIQIGALPDAGSARAKLASARRDAPDLLAGAGVSVTPVQHGRTLYRARFVGLSASGAQSACARLAQRGIDCMLVRPSSTL
jgi:D-alanyl-D-alanine carboxypeptidase